MTWGCFAKTLALDSWIEPWMLGSSFGSLDRALDTWMEPWMHGSSPGGAQVAKNLGFYNENGSPGTQDWEARNGHGLGFRVIRNSSYSARDKLLFVTNKSCRCHKDATGKSA